MYIFTTEQHDWPARHICETKNMNTINNKQTKHDHRDKNPDDVIDDDDDDDNDDDDDDDDDNDDDDNDDGGDDDDDDDCGDDDDDSSYVSTQKMHFV